MVSLTLRSAGCTGTGSRREFPFPLQPPPPPLTFVYLAYLFVHLGLCSPPPEQRVLAHRWMAHGASHEGVDVGSLHRICHHWAHMSALLHTAVHVQHDEGERKLDGRVLNRMNQI